MKNYILLGIGIGLIISGSLFTYLDNKEYEEMREIIRREIELEFTKEKAFEAIENEFELLIKNTQERVEVKEEKVEEKPKEEAKKEVVKVEKEEEKVAIAKFSPLKEKENIYSIQFRSGKDKNDIIKIQNQIGNIIDTKIEFIQGFYRLFAKDLYSEEYAQIIAHEVRREYGLNPVVRSPKQYDYMVLGPKKYNEKYGLVEKKEEEVKKVEEKKTEIVVETVEEKKVEESLKEKAEEVKSETIIAEDFVEEKEKSTIEIEEVKNEDVDKVSLNGVTITKYESVESKEEFVTPTSIETNVKEEVTTSEGGVEVVRDTRLVFLTDGTEEEYINIKDNISNLIELEVEEKDNRYQVKSKEYFTNIVAEDLSGKLKLLFNIDVEKEIKE